jgi:putative peptidoglycan lipid II flippase
MTINDDSKKDLINPKKETQNDFMGTLGKDEKQGKVLLHALAMSAGTMISRVLGLVRDLLFAAYFPLEVKDAWTAAFRLPNLFRRILGEGSLAVSFVPQFVKAKNEDRIEAQNLVNSFYSMLLIVLTVLTALGVLFPEWFLHWLLDPSYIAQTQKYELTVRMAQIMFVFIFFMSVYAFFMGILNALGKFALAAFAPTLFNIAMLFANFTPENWSRFSGEALAWGVVIGGFLQMAILIPALKKNGFTPKLTFNFLNPRALKVWRNMVPGMLGLGLLQVTTIVNLRFASSLGDGPITYIYLADRLLELPLSLISVSIGVALLPTLSQYWTEKKPELMAQTANYYMRLNLFLAIPAAVGLFVLGLPIVKLLFLRGHFSLEDATATTTVLQIYAFTLVVSSCVRVLVPSFYAIGSTWIPAVVSGVCVVVHIILAPVLMKEFGLAGLVSSNVASSALNLVMLFVFYKMYIGSFDHFRLIKSLFLFLISGFVMGLSLYLLQFALRPEFESFGSLLIQVLCSILVGVIVYFAMCALMKMEEYDKTIATLSNKIRRRFRL